MRDVGCRADRARRSRRIILIPVKISRDLFLSWTVKSYKHIVGAQKILAK